jgi:integrase
LLDADNVGRTWNRILKVAGLEGFRLYDSRHTALTRMAELGINPDATRLIAGHKDVRTTLNYYTHGTASMTRDAMKQVGNLYSDAEIDSQNRESA